MLGGLVTVALGGIKDWFLNRQKIAAAETENRQRLLRDEKSNNHEWEMASLADKDKWLRRISFAIFVWPMTPISIWKPEWLSQYYESLSTIPEWNVQLIYVMIAGVWGVAELKNSLPALIGGIAKAVRKE